MDFLSPVNAWFAASIPLIILLYLLKKRRQPLTVSSNMLWERLLEDMEANTPWQKLKRNLLLLLQLAAAFLLVLALVRPYLPLRLPLAADTIVLVDASATMQAADVSPSRFAAAKMRLEELIERLGDRRLAIIRVDEQPEVISPLTADKARLEQALKNLKPGFGRADFPQAFSLAGAMAKESKGPLIVVFSDGVNFSAPEKFAFPVNYQLVGDGGINLGIERLATRRSAGGVVALARIKNYSTEGMQAELELYADSNLIDVRSIELAPGESKSLYWREVPGGTRVLEGRLVVEDDFSLDNRAAAVLEPTTQLKGLLVTEGNIFLERALNLVSQTTLYKTTPASYRPGEFDFYVFDGWLPEKLPAGPLLAVNLPERQDIFPVEGEVGPALLETSAGSSLLEFTGLKDVFLARAQVLKALPASSFLMAGGRSVAATYSLRGSRQAVLAFDLHDTDLPLQAGFPILINNLLEWLAPSSPVTVPAVRVGEPVPVFLNSRARRAVVTTPRRKVVELPARRGDAVFAGTSYPGLYKLEQYYDEGGIEAAYFTVEIPPLEDRGILPQSIPVQQAQKVSAGLPREGRHELWPWLTLVVLVIAAAEWWVYTNGY